MTPPDSARTPLIAGNINRLVDGFGEGDYGGDTVAGRRRLADTLGVRPATRSP